MSSPLILSLSTVFALIGIVLVAIAFGTNNWLEYHVKRAEVLKAVRNNQTLRVRNIYVNASDIYFDRTYGLFRECFPDKKPDDFTTYMSPLGAPCIDRKNDYQVPETKAIVDSYTEDQRTRMHLLRACVAFYIVGLFFLLLCLFTGITGCWRRSPGLILTTGILLLFSTLFLVAAMAVWHGVDYMEREVVTAGSHFKTWDPLLKKYSEMTYGWSYIVSWIGIGFVLVAAITMLSAYRAMKDEEKEEDEKKRAPYMMPNYYDKSAMVPYGAQYAQYPYAYPAAAYYGQYGNYAGNGYYGYATYGR